MPAGGHDARACLQRAKRGAPPPEEPAKEEEGDDELPQVVQVSRIKHKGEVYLVDKGKGIVCVPPPG